MKHYAKLCAALLPLAMVAGCESTGPTSTKSVSVGSQGSDAVRATVEVQGLREELANLRNEIELQRNQLEKLTQRQRELYDDLDYRLRQRERSSGAIAVGPPATGTEKYGTSNTGSGLATSTVAGGATGQTSQGITGSTGTASQNTGQTVASIDQGSAAPPVMVQQDAIAIPEEQVAYDEAFNLLKQSRYQESVAAFGQQLAQYPNGALADDAQYWIGEAMYVTRDFPSGLKAFQSVVQRFPESARVAEAMLKLGYIQYEMGAREDARATLTEVVNRFPGSRVSISAQTRLRKLQAEGD
jgi:tol-pal system protein YbgF